MVDKIRSSVLALDLLASTALQSPHLFQHTHTVHLEIFDTYPNAHADVAKGIKPFCGDHPSDPRFAATWAESVSSILSVVPAVEHLVCDWFMDMEGVSARIQQLSKLRSLQLRGIKYDCARLSDDLILPAGLEALRLNCLELDSGLNFKMANGPSTAPTRLKLETINCHTYEEPESEFDDDLVGTPTITQNKARYTDARIVYDDRHADPEMLKTLKQSRNSLETLEFFDGCLGDLEWTEEFHLHFERYTNLHRLGVSFWNVPDHERVPGCVLKELTHLQLNVSQEEIGTFSTRFEAKLNSIKEGRLMPKLESIKLSTRTLHGYSQGNEDRRKWSSLRLFIQSE